MRYASVDKVRTRVKDILAKQQHGFITTTEYNSFAAQAQQRVFDDLLSKYKLYQQSKSAYVDPKRGNYMGIENVKDLLRPLIRDRVSLSISASGSTTEFSYPTDYAYYINLAVGTKNVDVLEFEDYNALANSSLTSASTTFPVCLFNYDSIELLPAEASSNVKLTYFKTPRGTNNSGVAVDQYPTWASTTVGNNAVYNATNSINFELPELAEDMLVVEILKLASENLRELEITQLAELEQQKETQE